MPAPRSTLTVVFGSMTFGEAGTSGARVHDVETASEILDVFQRHGHTEVDTARTYSEGTTEKMLGQLDWQARGLVVETKLFPGPARPPRIEQISHSPADLRKHLDISLSDLKTDRIKLWYLHRPDYTVPYHETFEAIDQLHREGKFEELGLSNYSADDVASICEMCKANGWIAPTVYQGIYNALHRGIEPDLFPVMRTHDIRLYAFNPILGGLLTKNRDEEVEAGSRFDPDKTQGMYYRERYWHDEYFRALEILRPACGKEGISPNEAALRWMSHHSMMKPEHRDAVIIGASSLAHIEQNLADLEKGPLPPSVVEAFDEAWQVVKGRESCYYRKRE